MDVMVRRENQTSICDYMYLYINEYMREDVSDVFDVLRTVQ